MTDNVKIHVIRSDIKSNAMVKRYMSNHVPRIGDELRVDEVTIYKVTKVVWCLDEPECPFDRVNIGVKLVRSNT